jgi:hypothetical protein
MRFARPLLWLTCAALLGGSPATAQLRRPQTPPALTPATGTPVPELLFAGRETYQVGAQRFVRYWFDILNKWQYSNDLFTAAPSLPPCGENRNAARTWVDLFAANGARIYGFCALASTAQLGMIWFAVPEGQAPPSRIYVEMIVRQTGTRYRSGLAPTSR